MGIVAIVVGVLLAIAALAAGGLLWFLRRPLPQTRGTIHTPGLQRPVEVLRDRWGVPHLYAESEADLFFAQGYVHAQERLWQMELQRRIGSGRLSEILGELTLEVDRFFRVVGFRRAAQADFEVMDGESRRALDAYAAGVNAFITARRGRWSVEFSLLRFEPEPWQPVDSLCWAKVMAWNLGCNWASELLRARLAAQLGADRAADLEPPYPADNPPIVHGPGIPPGSEPPPNGWRSAALRDALRLVEGLLAPPAPPARRLPSTACRPSTRRPAAATSGSWPAAARPAASRCWPTTPTCPSSCRPPGSRSTWWAAATTWPASRCRARRASSSATTSTAPGG